jgi:hypothetical protein
MFTIDLANLDGASGFSIQGIDAQDFSGFSVAGAGDFNGDGFEDLIIGAYGGDAGGSLSGETYVVFGKSGSFGQFFNVGSLDGSDGFRIDGIAANDFSGFSVSSAGDVNKDGFDDLLIGASNASPGGAAYVVFGRAASAGPIVPLSALDGADGFRLESAVTGDQAGRTVNEAGDFNGDGIDDFLVTAPNADRTATTDGAVFVVFGGAAFAATAEIDQLDGTDGFRLTGFDNFESIGSGAPSFGDVNGDGLADIIIGAPQADVVGGDSGAAYVVFGTTSPLAASQSVSFLDGADGFRVTGTISGDNLGRATGAGDINGDGFDDIIVSAPRCLVPETDGSDLV